MGFSNYFSLFSIIQKSLPTSLYQREEISGKIPSIDKEGPGGICRIVDRTNPFHLPSPFSLLPSPFSLVG
jgi:hypothetical protein